MGVGNSIYVEEALIKNNPIIPLPVSISRAQRSLCKIQTENKIASGFLIQLSRGTKDFFCLMTNEHVVTKSLIKKTANITFFYDYEIKKLEIQLNQNERFIKDFRDMKIDVTIIEILPEDNIDKTYFLSIDKNYIEEFNELENNDIIILHYPKGISAYSFGKIIEIKDNEFTHSASTDSGSSGGPVFLKGNMKVLGIHKASGGENIKNYANFIGPIYNYLLHNLNQMRIIYNIENKNKISIFSTNFINNNRNNCYIIIEGEKKELCEYLTINEKQKEKNELEIILIENKIINDFSYMFSDSLKTLPDISRWNTENITNMSHMFFGCNLLESLPDISKWDTKNVKDMSYMFSGCKSLVSLPDISKWNIKNVKDMSYMFKGCKSLASLPDISKWEKENNINMSHMFDECNFTNNNNVNILNSPKIQEASKSLCKIVYKNNEFCGFFVKLKKNENDFFCLLTSIKAIKNEMIYKKNSIDIFYDKNSIKKEIELNCEKRYMKDFSEFEIGVISVEILPEDNIEKNYFLESDLNNIIDLNSLINSNIIILSNESDQIHYLKGKIKEINKHKFKFIVLAKVKSPSIGSPIFLESNLKVIGIYIGCKYDNSENYGNFIEPIFNSFENFSINENIIEIQENNKSIDEKKQKKEIDYSMNKNNINIKLNQMTIIYNIRKDEDDIQLFGSKFVSNNKNKCYLLINLKRYELCVYFKLEANDKEKDILEVKLIETKPITNMEELFHRQRYYSSLKSLPDISKWDTENVINMECMFDGCESLISLPDISKWDTENVINMKCMFYNCESLVSLPDISKWDNKNVTNMECPRLCHI